MIRPLLNSLLYFPSRAIIETPQQADLDYRDLELECDDGERLHGWWVDARTDSLGHLLLCHGNAGNVGDRVLHAALLTAAGSTCCCLTIAATAVAAAGPARRAPTGTPAPR